MPENKKVITDHRLFDFRRNCDCEICRINKRIERLSNRWNKSTREIVVEILDLWVGSVKNYEGLTNAISVIQEADRVEKEIDHSQIDQKDPGVAGS